MIRAFVNGLLRPSGLAVVSAVIVAAGLLGGLVITVDADFLRSPNSSRYLFADREDYDVAVTSGILRVAARHEDRPLVLVVGASETHCMVDPGRFRERLADAGLRDEDILILTQNGQGLGEAATIARSVPDGTAGIMVLCLNVSKYCQAEERAGTARDAVRLGVREPRFEDGARSFPGELLWTNRRFYGLRIRHLVRNLLTRPPALHPFDRFDDDPPMSDRLWKFRGERYLQRLQRMEEHAPRNLALIAEIRDDLERRTRMSLVAVTLPLNPRFVEEFLGADRYRQCDSMANDGLAAVGIPNLHLSALNPPADAYWDWIHLKSQSMRAEVTDRIAGAVIERIATAPEPGP